MNAIRRICVALAVLCALFLVACTADGAPQPYANGACVHSFSSTWYDVAPAEEGAPVTEEVHYCRICHTPETREKE